MNNSFTYPIWKFIAVFIVLIPTWNLNAQDEYADSIRKVIVDQKNDHEKADNYFKLSYYYLSKDWDSLHKYAQYLYETASRINDAYFMARGDIYEGSYNAAINEYDQALFYYLRAFHLADSVQDTLNTAKAALNAGSVLSKLSRDKEAIEYYLKSLRSFSSKHDTAGIVASYTNIGMSYFMTSAYDSAAYYFIGGMKISEMTKKKPYLSTIYYNLADVYKSLNDYERAEKYALKSIEFCKTSGNERDLAQAYNTLGLIQAEQLKYPESLECYKKAEEIFLKKGDALFVNHVYNNLGVLYKEQKNYPLASIYFDKALDGYSDIGYIRGVIFVLGNQGRILSDLGKHEEAIKLQDSVVYLADKYDYPNSRKDAYEDIYLDYFKLGKYKQALEYQTRFYELKDSLFNIDKEKLIKELVLKYEKQKDEAQILVLEKANLEKDISLKKRTIQRNAFLFTVIIVVALAIFLLLYFYQRRIKDKIIAEQKIRQLEEEKKLLAARSVVEGQEEERKRIAQELHDGLGVLLSATKMQFTSIRDASPENRLMIERATKLLEQASIDVRKISHNMMPGLLMKLGLYEAIEDLIDHINETENLQARCAIPEDLKRLPENQEIMIYRIIQEMVNNTIKHAEAANISLSIAFPGDHFEFLYSDDGKGFDVEKMLEKNTLGLKSIKSRVNFLNGDLKIESQPGMGVKYTVRVPV